MFLLLWSGIEDVPVGPGARQRTIFNKIGEFLIRGTLKRSSDPLRSVRGEGAAPNQLPDESVPFCSDNIHPERRQPPALLCPVPGCVL